MSEEVLKQIARAVEKGFAEPMEALEAAYRIGHTDGVYETIIKEKAAA